jgi:hypothetical protein
MTAKFYPTNQLLRKSQSARFNGQFLDDICFSLLRKEWAESLSWATPNFCTATFADILVN